MTRLTVLAATDPRPPMAATVVDIAHPDEAARRRFSRPGAFDAAALVWTDGERPDGPRTVLRARRSTSAGSRPTPPTRTRSTS